MRAASFAIGLCIVGLFVLGMVSGVSAASVQLNPGVPYSVTKHADTFGFVNYSWSVTPSTSHVHFVITDPSGDSPVDVTDNSGDSFIIAPRSGTYTFTWTNIETSSVTLDYDVTVEPGFGPIEHAIDTVVIAAIIGAAVVVIVIVLIVLLVMRGSKKPQHPATGPPAQYAPTGEAPAPYIPGMCPKCGNPIDSQHVFCPKCGFRVR